MRGDTSHGVAGATPARAGGYGRARERGFTLIEGLVTLAVLSIALLGLAMLQGGGARFVSDAAVRSQATLLAYDIIDRMRMNPAAAAAYTAGDPGGACDTATASVDNDLNCWYQAIADTLPQGNGSIAQSGAAFTVVLSWRDRNTRGATAEPITQAMQVTVEL